MAFNKKAHLRDNIEAIRLAFTLDKEGRQATPAERGTLEKYSGFGGIKAVLSPADKPEDVLQWTKTDSEMFPLVVELHEVLRSGSKDTAEYNRYVSSLKNSVLSAFYTPPKVVDALAAALKESGVNPVRLLDPSAGTGVFPEAVKQLNPHCEATRFEKDMLTGKILSHLNPVETVRVEGFENIEQRYNGYFDVAASNIPFGDVRVFDPAYSTKDDAHRQASGTIHNYFFMKGVDCVREGGLVAFITSQGVLNSEVNRPVREWLMERCEPVSAVRFPNNLFTDHAGTEVGSDLIILQKKASNGKLSERQQDFIDSRKLSNGISVNNLFQSFDRVIHDNVKVGTDPYGKPAMEFTHSGGVGAIAAELRGILRDDFAKHLDIEYYQEQSPEAHTRKSTHQLDWEENSQGIDDLFSEEDLAEISAPEIQPEQSATQSRNYEPTAQDRQEMGEMMEAAQEKDRELFMQAQPEDYRREQQSEPAPNDLNPLWQADELDPFWQTLEDDWFPDDKKVGNKQEQTVAGTLSKEDHPAIKEEPTPEIQEKPVQPGIQGSLNFDFSYPVPPLAQSNEPTAEAKAVEPAYSVNNQPLISLYDLFGLSAEERTQTKSRNSRSRRRMEIPQPKAKQQRKSSKKEDERPLEWREELILEACKKKEEAERQAKAETMRKRKQTQNLFILLPMPEKRNNLKGYGRNRHGRNG
jgi:type I restriction-modification system DNA methylase subunit